MHPPGAVYVVLLSGHVSTGLAEDALQALAEPSKFGWQINNLHGPAARCFGRYHYLPAWRYRTGSKPVEATKSIYRVVGKTPISEMCAVQPPNVGSSWHLNPEPYSEEEGACTTQCVGGTCKDRKSQKRPVQRA